MSVTSNVYNSASASVLNRTKHDDVLKRSEEYLQENNKRNYISPNITNNNQKIRDIKVLRNYAIKKIKEKSQGSDDQEIARKIKKTCEQSDQKIQNLELENGIYAFRDRYKTLLQDSLLKSITDTRDKKILSPKEDQAMNSFVEKRCDQVTDHVIKTLYGPEVKKFNPDTLKKALFHLAVTVPLDVFQFVVGYNGGPASAICLGSDILNTEFNLGYNVANPDVSLKKHTKDWINRQMFTLVLVPPLMAMQKMNINTPEASIALGAGSYAVSQGVRSQLPKLVDKFLPASDTVYKVVSKNNV